MFLRGIALQIQLYFLQSFPLRFRHVQYDENYPHHTARHEREERHVHAEVVLHDLEEFRGNDDDDAEVNVGQAEGERLDVRREQFAQEQHRNRAHSQIEYDHVRQEGDHRNPLDVAGLVLRLVFEVGEDPLCRQRKPGTSRREDEERSPAGLVHDDGRQRGDHELDREVNYGGGAGRYAAAGVVENRLGVKRYDGRPAELLHGPDAHDDVHGLPVALHGEQVPYAAAGVLVFLNGLAQPRQFDIYVVGSSEHFQAVPGTLLVVLHQQEVRAFRHERKRNEVDDRDGGRDQRRRGYVQVRPDDVDQEEAENRRHRYRGAQQAPDRRPGDFPEVNGQRREANPVGYPGEEPGAVQHRHRRGVCHHHPRREVQRRRGQHGHFPAYSVHHCRRQEAAEHGPYARHHSHPRPVRAGHWNVRGFVEESRQGG